MHNPEKSFALITGASQGLGRAFANQLAARKTNLILISLPGQGLHAIARLLEARHGIEVISFETDLSDPDNVIALSDRINEAYNIHLLINNAGIGGTKAFTQATSEYINTIIQVNIAALVMLTHRLLPNLMRQPRAFILNVASMAAFSPIGYKTVYPASKAFVHSFSRSLYSELSKTNVFVSVVNPGAMKTNPEIVARIQKQGFLGRLTLLDPEKVAKRCIERLYKRDTVIMVNPVGWLFLMLLPVWIKLPLLTNAVKREIR